MTTLRAFVRRLAAKSARRPTIEDVLLGGRFYTYAGYRLVGFFAARGLSVLTHLLELTLLFSLFSGRHLVGAFVVQQTTLLAQGFVWGCLEVMRARLREQGSKTEAIRRIERWLTAGLWLGLAITVVAFVRVGVVATAGRGVPVLEIYIAVCVLRIGVDLVARTYYSGVFALRRVHRPLWTILIAEPIGLLLIVLTFPSLRLLSFVAGLLATVIVSRGVLVLYSRRAYVQLRLPAPRFRWFRIGRAPYNPASFGLVLKAGFANLATRVGSILVLTSLIGPLMSENPYTPLVLGLQVSASLLGATTYFAQVFYHDFKRLEADAFAPMRRRLSRRLLPTALGVGVVLWAASGVALYVFLRSWALVSPVVVLLPVYLALAWLSVLQLREFVRGEFGRMLVSAGVNIVALVAGGYVIEEPTMISWSAVLTASLIAGGIVLLLPFGQRRPVATGVHASLQAFLRSLSAVSGPVHVARLGTRDCSATECSVIGARIAEMLGTSGGVAVLAPWRRVLWFRRGGERLARDRVIVAASGKATSLLETPVCDGGTDALAQSDSAGILRRRGTTEQDVLVEAFRRKFQDRGLVADLSTGRLSPDLLRLDRRARRELWRDAARGCRLGNTSGQISDLEVTSYRPGGELRILFAVPRSEPADVRQAWRDRIAGANWDASACVPARSPVATGAGAR